MDAPTAPAPKTERPAPPAPPRPQFRARGAAVWLPGCVVAGVLAGGIAAVAGSYFHPMLIFPLLVGVLLGASLVLLMRLLQTGHRPTLVAGAVVAAACCVAAQHYFSYLGAWRKHDRDRSKWQQKADLLQQAPADFAPAVMDRMPAAPGRFDEYMVRQAEQGRPIGPWRAQGALAWLSWAAEGLLQWGAALALVVTAMRLPYCDRCGSWYRTIRAGKLLPEAAHRLAAIAGADLPAELLVPRFRLQSCAGGCGPTTLDLFWECPQEGPASRQTWLDPAQRDEVTRTLDHV